MTPETIMKQKHYEGNNYLVIVNSWSVTQRSGHIDRDSSARTREVGGGADGGRHKLKSSRIEASLGTLFCFHGDHRFTRVTTTPRPW